MAEDTRYILAKLAIEQGDRFQAQEKLTELLKEDQNNVEYWLLMSTVVNSKKERVFCLKKVTSIDPRNREARLGLILDGALNPGDPPLAEIRKRDWTKDLTNLREKEKPKKERKKSRYNYKQLIPVVAGALVILLVLFFSGLLVPGMRSIFSPRLTITPVTMTPEIDLELAAALTGTPNPILQTPIGRVLPKPYTSTPAYVLTPHPRYDIYETALDAYQRGDFETMLTYMRGAEDQLGTPDIVFLVGEALRNLGKYSEANDQYERAIFLESGFAPAYFGRALVSQVVNPNLDIKPDLDQALLLDPAYGEVYITRAKYYLDRGDFQLAFGDANQAVQYLPGSHLAHLYKAWSLLELGDFLAAENSIETALNLDLNYVPSYLIAGRIALERGDAATALDKLKRYDPYISEKSWQFYYSLGKAYYLTGGDLTIAESSLSRAITLGGNSSMIYQTRSQVYVSLGEMDKAVSDALSAQFRDPDDFLVNLFLGKILYDTGDTSQSLEYLNLSEELAESEGELAKVYYWRANLLDSLNNEEEAVVDWQNLMNLPLEFVPDQWELIAAERLLPTATPSPTVTPSPTITPSPTTTSSITPTETNTPTETQTPSPTP